MPDGLLEDRWRELLTEVRYAESDQMGYAHHTTALVWFELGRVAWLRDRGLPYTQLEARGVLMPVVRVDLRFHSPARFEDQVIIQTRLVSLGRARLSFENRAWRQDRAPGAARTLLAEGTIELCCVDRRGKAQRLPPDVRAVLGGGTTDG